MLQARLYSWTAVVGLCLCGCESGSQPASPTDSPVSVAPPNTVEEGGDAHGNSDHEHDHAHGDHGDHGHPTEGPHHGALVELGNEEYHAEVIHEDATGTVTVYLLDSHAEKSVTTTATEVVINLKHGDTPEQFKLAAQPEEGNPAGQSSRFSLTNKELVEHLHEAAAGVKLNVMIADTPFAGTVPAEDHAHHGHVHAGDDALVWQKKFEAQGYQIQLGHHGTDLHAGTKCEPAVSISRDGQDIADAQVFNALLSEDGQTELVAEVATTYEPASSEEPAHYAQGSVMIPANVKQVTLRIRIVLPGNAEEIVESISVPVH